MAAGQDQHAPLAHWCTIDSCTSLREAISAVHRSSTSGALRAEERTVLLELASLAHWCTIDSCRSSTDAISPGHQ